jgi:hypothetical protein
MSLNGHASWRMSIRWWPFVSQSLDVAIGNIPFLRRRRRRRRQQQWQRQRPSVESQPADRKRKQRRQSVRPSVAVVCWSGRRVNPPRVGRRFGDNPSPARHSRRTDRPATGQRDTTDAFVVSSSGGASVRSFHCRTHLSTRRVESAGGDRSADHTQSAWRQTSQLTRRRCVCVCVCVCAVRRSPVDYLLSTDLLFTT